ncbi:uncharacterized protein DC041_0002452 [Schistosoma bovis]|uniref:Kinesin-associated protein 3 n=1 Tax=Schistosoma bovis TaxID=6184 RepID=A0A430QKG4_SCHBO|nr:uncharacterized protein DC041_0002452 [Schistosoma bovis]
MVEDAKFLKSISIFLVLNYLLLEKPSIISETLADPGAFDSTEINEIAHLTELEDYLELLYEGISEKLRASALILQLARNSDNLEELFQNGALIMTIIDHELKKYDLWVEELERKHKLSNNKSETSLTTDGKSLVDEAQNNYETSFLKYKSLVRKQEQLFRVSFYLLLNISEDINVEIKMHNKGIVTMICKCLNRDNFELLILLVSFLKKLSIFSENKDEMLKNGIIDRLSKILCRPEEDLVNLCLRLLYNLSFDTSARLEMVSKGVLNKIVGLLENTQHQPVALYILYHLTTEAQSRPAFVNTHCLSFLKKLILENPEEKSDLIPMALGINLVLDNQCANAMLGEGRCFKLMSKRAIKFRDQLIMKLLRNAIQNNDLLKLKMVDFLPELLKIVTEEKPFLMNTPRNLYSSTKATRYDKLKVSSKKHLNIEALNSKTNQNNTSSLLENRLKMKIHKTDDVINGVCNEDDDNDNEKDDDDDDDDDENEFRKKEDFKFECLGCLANLNLKDIQYSKVITEFSLLKWIKSQLESVHVQKSNDFLSTTSEVNNGFGPIFSSPMLPNHLEDDEILEIVRMLSAICQDPDAGKMVIEAGVVHNLIGLLNVKQEDDEIVFQIVYTFFQLTFHESTRNLLVKTTQAVAYLVDLMHDKNADIRKLCDITLDIVCEYESDWRIRIQTERFRWHNSQWLEMIDTATKPSLLDNSDSTTEAALAAVLGVGHARSQYHSNLLTDDDLNNIVTGDDNDNRGYFGMGLDIDDAAAFLMSLSSNNEGRKRSSGSENILHIPFENNNYMNHLNMLCPDMYGGVNFLSNERVSPGMTVNSHYDSDSDTTQKESGSRNTDYENDIQEDKIPSSGLEYFNARNNIINKLKK